VPWCLGGKSSSAAVSEAGHEKAQKAQNGLSRGDSAALPLPQRGLRTKPVRGLMLLSGKPVNSTNLVLFPHFSHFWAFLGHF